jgi:hypothetical protein
LQERTGRVEFKQKNGTLSALLTIVQSGEAPAVQVDKETVSAPYGGGEYSVNVTSNIFLAGHFFGFVAPFYGNPPDGNICLPFCA